MVLKFIPLCLFFPLLFLFLFPPPLQEEEAQAKALDLLLHKKHIRELPKTQNRDVSRPATIYDEDWIVMAPPEGKMYDYDDYLFLSQCNQEMFQHVYMYVRIYT